MTILKCLADFIITEKKVLGKKLVWNLIKNISKEVLRQKDLEYNIIKVFTMRLFRRD